MFHGVIFYHRGACIAFIIVIGCMRKGIALHTDSVILHHALLTADSINESAHPERSSFYWHSL